MAPRVIGKVAALFRYPVKSMGSEPLESVDVDWNGFAGDRRCMMEAERPRGARRGQY